MNPEKNVGEKEVKMEDVVKEIIAEDLDEALKNKEVNFLYFYLGLFFLHFFNVLFLVDF